MEKKKKAMLLLPSWEVITEEFIKKAVREMDKTFRKEKKKGLKEITKSKNLAGQFLFKRKIKKAVLKEVNTKWQEYSKQLLKKNYQSPLERKRVYEMAKGVKMKSIVFKRVQEMIEKYLNDFFKSQ